MIAELVLQHKRSPKCKRGTLGLAFVLCLTAPVVAAPVIRHVELMTVTDTSAVLTWETDEPADTVVRYGTQSDHLDRTAASREKPTRFHYGEIRGLRPGTEYFCLCQSGAAAAGLDSSSPVRFTTLVAPPGKELFSFATMTDTHVGQQVVARVVINRKVVSPGVRWRRADLPFWQLTTRAAIDEINEKAPAFTIIKGDITDSSARDQFAKARQLFNRLKQPYHVVRGNHDWALEPFLKTFGIQRPWYSFTHAGMPFIVLDTEPLANDKDPAIERELTWLADDLKRHSGRWTFVFVHQPIEPALRRDSDSGLTAGLMDLGRAVAEKWYGPAAGHVYDIATGRTPSVPEDRARRVAALLRGHDRIAGVFAGHLHRNYVGCWPEQTGNLPYVETAPTKEYPCGYAITRVFSGGYMQNYYTPHDPECLEWSSMTRDAYVKIGYGSKIGSLADRNFVITFDALNLTAAKK
jgi:3',5'-cyclic-AMP phosphodiesterase